MGVTYRVHSRKGPSEGPVKLSRPPSEILEGRFFHERGPKVFQLLIENIRINNKLVVPVKV